MAQETTLELRSRLIDRLLQGTSDDFLGVLGRFEGTLLSWLDGNRELSSAEQAALVEAGDLEDVLEQAGLSALLSARMQAALQDSIPLLRRQLVAGGYAPELVFDVAAFESLLEARLEALTARLTATVLGEVRGAWADSVLLGTPLETALRTAVAQLRATAPVAMRREVELAFSAMDRALLVQTGAARGSAFYYVGPDDRVTRPTCKVAVNKVFSLEQLSRMNNGQTANTLVTCGGYGCRHILSPVRLPNKNLTLATEADVQAFNAAGERKRK